MQLIIIRIYVDSETDVLGVKYSSISILYFKSVEKLNINSKVEKAEKNNKLITNLVSSESAPGFVQRNNRAIYTRKNKTRLT